MPIIDSLRGIFLSEDNNNEHLEKAHELKIAMRHADILRRLHWERLLVDERCSCLITTTTNIRIFC